MRGCRRWPHRPHFRAPCPGPAGRVWSCLWVDARHPNLYLAYQLNDGSHRASDGHAPDCPRSCGGVGSPLQAALQTKLGGPLNLELEMTEKSLYERIGGEAAVDAAVDVFYRRVLADDRIAHYFENVEMGVQREKQKAFLTFAFGGPVGAAGGFDLRRSHASMKLTEADFDAVMEHLGATLQSLAVPHDLIAEAAGIALSVKSEILNR